MRKLAVLILISAFAVVSCNNKSTETKDNTDVEKSVSQENQNTVVLNIEGMTCEGCENTIKSGLESLPGIVKVKASHVDSNAIVVYDANQVTIEEMGEMVQKKGYKYIDFSLVE